MDQHEKRPQTRDQSTGTCSHSKASLGPSFELQDATASVVGWCNCERGVRNEECHIPLLFSSSSVNGQYPSWPTTVSHRGGVSILRLNGEEYSSNQPEASGISRNKPTVAL